MTLMNRRLFLTVTSLTALTIGLFALFFPEVLITQVKRAQPSEAAFVMARTVGILLVAVGLLDFLVRAQGDSPTMRAVLIANLVLQLGILPIDPLAYAHGVYQTLGSFLPNTILHVVLAAGFAYALVDMQRRPLSE
jgi:hypothetical protein